MGEMADMIIEQQMFYEDYAEHASVRRAAAIADRVRKNSRRGIWVTATREAIQVTKMGDGHLNRALAWARRNNQTGAYSPAIDMLRAEIHRRSSVEMFGVLDE